jgi:hypothetical protein
LNIRRRPVIGAEQLIAPYPEYIEKEALATNLRLSQISPQSIDSNGFKEFSTLLDVGFVAWSRRQACKQSHVSL